jgi:hypothetical protein
MKRHSLDVLSLVFGLIFLLVAVSWIVRRSVEVDLPGPGWYIAGALIIAGLFGIISTVRGSLSSKASQPEELPPYQPADSTQEFGTITESKPEDRGV